MWQYITLMKRIYLIDCPGIVPPSLTDSPEDILLRGVVRVENVENPAQYVPAVLAMCTRRHLERTYEISGWAEEEEAGAESGKGKRKVEDEGMVGVEQMVGTPKSDKVKTKEAIRFLELLARKGGRLLKGGEADMDGVAKMVLNDFLRGKIPWFVPPPTSAGEGEGAEVSMDAAVKGGEVDGTEAGRDEKLGFTHGKRKRELEERVGEGARRMQAVNEEANGLDPGEDGAEDDEEDGDDFEGFDEEDADEDGGVEVEVLEGETDDESEVEEAQP